MDHRPARVATFWETTVTTIMGLCGNPVPQSKTLAVTTELVAALAALLPGSSTEIVDLSSYGGKVLTWGDEEADAARTRVRSADVLVVSTPVYKGAYTGLLKGFLDGYDLGALAPCAAVPLTIAASPAHSLAGQTHLQPVLAELGCLMPGGTLHLPDRVAADPQLRAREIAEWLGMRAGLFASGKEGVR